MVDERVIRTGASHKLLSCAPVNRFSSQSELISVQIVRHFSRVPAESGELFLNPLNRRVLILLAEAPKFFCLFPFKIGTPKLAQSGRRNVNSQIGQAPFGQRRWFIVCTLVALGMCGGCRKADPPSAQDDKSIERLQQIWAAYSQAAGKLGRPPANAMELHEFLKNAPGNPAPEDVLRSPDDNENYVIIYGVDFGQLARTTGNVDVVIAYEAKGKNGKRHVLKPQSIVRVVTDAEFQALKFPPGHQPQTGAAPTP
jgi:hypothetical protein